MAEQKYSHAKAGVSASGFKNSGWWRVKKETQVVLDLCCGRGGWAAGFLTAGWIVIGIDIRNFKDYPSTLIVRDVLKVRGSDYAGSIDAVVASPPCTEFSKHDAPGLFKDLPAPSMELVNHCFEIARSAGVPIVLENVRGLQKFIGPAIQHFHSFYLWGNGVPPLKPYAPGRSGRPVLKWNHRSATLRAVIPFELAYTVANYLRYFQLVPPDAEVCQVGRGTSQGGSCSDLHGEVIDPSGALTSSDDLLGDIARQ